MNDNHLSLIELNSLVRRAIQQCMPNEYWLQAELSDVRSNSTGHCYLEFVQKDPRNNNLIAKARGTIWGNVYRLLQPYFEEATGQAFASGIKVLVKVTAEFHELYGFSLTVTDIDPTYTVGDMARRRREILLQLENEGVLTLNKELPLPELIRRIAVISSPTAAGYEDFRTQLQQNNYGFYFSSTLFPAIMQGNQVESSIINALNLINAESDKFDIVVIIRGGGATSDLSGFDTYLLAANCAQFPLPIITGIGHERDDTVIDSVAHTRVKTPTAAADLVINRLCVTANQLESLTCRLTDSVTKEMARQKNLLHNLTVHLPMLVNRYTMNEKHLLSLLTQHLQTAITTRLDHESHLLELLTQWIQSASPDLLLKRGYSITFKDGKALTEASTLKKGDLLTTRFAEGEITSKVQ